MSKNSSPRQLGLIERILRLILGGIFRGIWLLFSRVAMVVLIIVGLATAYIYSTLPTAKEHLRKDGKGSVVMLDRRGEIFAWRGDQFEGAMDASEASPHLRNAVVAIEDKRFYRHIGLDPRGIARAMKANIEAGRVVQGGSTLTQQVAKLLFFDNSRSYVRHIKQIPYVLAMEIKYSKEEILSIYLNRAFLGAGSHGFAAAANRYFGKAPRNLTIAESAMLAGLLKAPTRYAPTRNLDRAQGRAQVIVEKMAEQGYISAAEAADAIANPARLSRAAQQRAGGYFADWLMEAAPEFLTTNTSEHIEIQTTFDRTIQRAAEQALTHVFETKVREGSQAQAAIVVMSKNGAVRAMVGGRQLGNTAGQFNRATQALRQTGSSFKPFVYAAALETGRSPYEMVNDRKITLTLKNGKSYSPKNYENIYKGDIPLKEALTRSSNVVAVKLATDVGLERVRALAYDFGIQSPIYDGPAMALGASESTLLEMTGAYAGLLNGGRQVLPFGAKSYRNRLDKSLILEGFSGYGPQVVTPNTAGVLSWMMKDVIESGTGKRAALPGWEAAGKTGTTQGAKDAWFIGYTSEYVAGVWMGYDDNTKLNDVTGGGLPAEIWKEVMLRVHEGIAPVPLPMVVPTPPVQQRDLDLLDQLVQQTQRDTQQIGQAAQRAAEKATKKVQDNSQQLLNDVINSLLGSN